MPKTPGHKLWRAVVEAATVTDADESTIETPTTKGGVPGSVSHTEPISSFSSGSSRESTAGRSSRGRLVRGVGDARLRAARAVLDTSGPFAWERGSWRSPVTNACALLKELLPSNSLPEGTGDLGSSSSSSSSSSVRSLQ